MTSVAAIAGRGGAFLGWRIVALATVTAALTGPGQTIGVSVFVDPMIGALSLTRSEVSTAYLIGTLVGAVALLPVGRLIDKVGTSRAMTLIGLAFGLGLLAMSGVQGFVTLAIGFTLIRWLGQGSLQLVSTLSVTPWFERRRGFAFGIMTTATATLMALTPVFLGAAIGAYGWRMAWVLAAVAIWLIVVPIARFGIIISKATSTSEAASPMTSRPTLFGNPRKRWFAQANSAVSVRSPATMSNTESKSRPLPRESASSGITSSSGTASSMTAITG